MCGRTTPVPGARSAPPASGSPCRDFEHGDAVTVAHRAFELDPGAPASSAVSSEEAVSRKYGMPLAQVRAGHDQLTALGARSASPSTSTGCAWGTPSTPIGSPGPHAGRRGKRRWCGGCSWPTSARGGSSRTTRCCATSPGRWASPDDHGRGAGRPRLRRRGARRRSRRRGARRDRRPLLPHRWRLAGSGRAGRRDARLCCARAWSRVSH